MPMDEIPARANNELDPDEHIVVVCHHGVRSANVTAWLRQQGFENAQSMRGGIDQWSRTIDPKVPMYSLAMSHWLFSLYARDESLIANSL